MCFLVNLSLLSIPFNCVLCYCFKDVNFIFNNWYGIAVLANIMGIPLKICNLGQIFGRIKMLPGMAHLVLHFLDLNSSSAQSVIYQPVCIHGSISL